MDLALTEYQQQLKNTARDFMDRECPKDTLVELDESETGYTDVIWQRASEIGWLGMLVPAEYGGTGGSLTDAAVVYEQLGQRAAVRAVLLVGSAWRAYSGGERRRRAEGALPAGHRQRAGHFHARSDRTRATAGTPRRCRCGPSAPTAATS